MTTLNSLQQSFQDYLLGKSKHFENEVSASKKAFAKQRLAIYSDAYRLRLLDVLKTDFPALSQWLSESQFAKLGFNYINTYPSKYVSARDFGAHFAAFIAQLPNLKQSKFIAQFAAFERAISENIDEPDAPILNFAQVAAIPPDAWPHMQFKLHPTVKTLTLDWNISVIRHALLTSGERLKASKCKTSEYWLVWRKDLAIHTQQLEPQEYFLFQAIAQQQTFAELCNGLCEFLAEQETAPYIVSWLQRWLNEHALSSLTV